MQIHILRTMAEPAGANRSTPVDASGKRELIASHDNRVRALFTVDVEPVNSPAPNRVRLRARGADSNPSATLTNEASQRDIATPATHAELLAELREWAKDPSAVVYVLAGRHGKLLIFPDDVIEKTDAQLAAYIAERCRS